METIKNTPFKNLTLPEDSEVTLRNQTLFVTKWNWDFESCLNFQKSAQAIIAKNRNFKVYIFCSHSHVYTMGRGNERGIDNLEDFDFNNADSLPFKIFKIHRGGGITFHHPGQWIFYPVCAIKESYTLDDHMCWLLKSVANTLKEEFKLDNILTAKKLMGVWCDRKKLASIGVGVNKFVTEQGIALNIEFDSDAKKGLLAINPCGMQSETYIDVKSLSQSANHSSFHKAYLSDLLD